MKRKVFTAMLALIMLASSCGNGGNANVSETFTDDSQSEPDIEVETDAYQQMDAKDFGGKKFTILDANQYPSIDVNIPGDTMDGEIINDALFLRGTEVGERFGVKINYVQTTPSDGKTAITNSVMSNDQDYQLIIGQICENFDSLARSHSLANLCEVSALSLEQPWWSRLMYENLRLNDIMYFTSGDISNAMYNMAACIYLNKKLLNDYGITTDYYQMVRDGKWTIDELTALGKDRDVDINEDGKLHTNDDFFGFVNQRSATTISMLLVGCGLKMSEIKDGTIEIDLGTDRAYEVYDKVTALTRYVYWDQQDDTIKKAFFTDRALSMLHLVSSTVMLRGMKSDFSVLPVPKYDEAQESYYSLCNPWCDAYIGIPANADYELSGTIAEALARYSYLYIRPKALHLNLEQKGLRDEESIEMLNIVYDNAYSDFNICYVFGGMTSSMAEAIASGKPVASIIAKNQARAQVAAQKLVDEVFTK